MPEAARGFPAGRNQRAGCVLPDLIAQAAGIFQSALPERIAMTIETLRDMLGWCAVINLGLLVWWFFFITVAHDWTYRLHRRWYKLSEEAFDAIHYAGIGLFKLGVLLFNVVPYLALRIVG
jgi:hypothetical protein